MTRRAFDGLLDGLRRIAEAAVVVLAIVLLAATLAAGLGLIPWPDLALRYGGQEVAFAGVAAQIGVTVLALMLVVFLPATQRMTRLERSHRSFAVGMEDVTRAYRIAHAADRTGVFALSGEFDSMRARFDHLRQHPDLRALEPELLELAARMSFLSRDLSRVYSDDKVARARGFLTQRQEDIALTQDRIAAARRTCDELRRWLTDVEAEERAAQTQIRRLDADLTEILPLLGYDFDADGAHGANVVSLTKPGKPP